MKYTPGPWRARKADKPGRFYVETEAVPHRTITGWGNVRQLEPDAHLIAAAPDLLEVLEDILEDYEVVAGLTGLKPEDFEVIRKARAVIARAKGK